MTRAEPSIDCSICGRYLQELTAMDVKASVRRHYYWCSVCDGPSKMAADDLKRLEKFHKEFKKE